MIVLVCGDDDVDLPTAVDRLAELGHEHVLCEGGASLLRTALTAAWWTSSTCRSHRRSSAADPGCWTGRPAGRVHLELRQLLEEDGVLFGRYRVRRSADQ